MIFIKRTATVRKKKQKQTQSTEEINRSDNENKMKNNCKQILDHQTAGVQISNYVSVLPICMHLSCIRDSHREKLIKKCVYFLLLSVLFTQKRVPDSLVKVFEFYAVYFEFCCISFSTISFGYVCNLAI